MAEFNLQFDLGGSEGQTAGLLVLVGLLVSFALIRMSTRLMRSPKVTWWPGSIKTEGGVHVHHLVFGIVLLMLAGFLQFALEPDSPWLEIFALGFGVGAGLTLDEYALWLHLEDVYWAEEGRRSVDAVIVAAVLGGVIVLGIIPLGDQWELDLSGLGGPVLDTTDSNVLVGVTVLLGLAVATLCALKGKFLTALVGMFIPPVGWVGAIRLAVPGSPWARRRYAEGSGKLSRAERRDQRRRGRLRWWQDLIGGKPTPAGPS